MPLDMIVLVKHIYDEDQLKVDQTTGSVSLQGVPGKVSSFDRNALEAALRLRQKLGGTITTLTVGTDEANKSIREALAMGADNAYLIRSNVATGYDARQTVEILIGALSKIPRWDVLICAEGSTDFYTSLLPGMLAERLNLPLLSYMRSLDFDGRSLRGDRSLERKLETVECSLPAIVSVVSEICEPRIPTLLQIMAATKKQISKIDVTELGLQIPPRYKLEGMLVKTVTRKRQIFEGSPSEVALKLYESLSKEGII
jgi:electron transfer flavoprotein beta subunit